MKQSTTLNEIEVKGDVAIIKLRRKDGTPVEAIIDVEDLDKVKQYRWSLAGQQNYVRAYIYLHRTILGENSPQIDHIDHDTLNNRKSNLRLTDHSHNFGNQRKRKTYKGKPTSSKYKGVSYVKKADKWIAQVTLYGKPSRLGTFENEEDAARAYNAKAVELFGDFARLNEI